MPRVWSEITLSSKPGSRRWYLPISTGSKRAELTGQAVLAHYRRRVLTGQNLSINCFRMVMGLFKPKAGFSMTPHTRFLIGFRSGCHPL